MPPGSAGFGKSVWRLNRCRTCSGALRSRVRNIWSDPQLSCLPTTRPGMGTRRASTSTVQFEWTSQLVCGGGAGGTERAAKGLVAIAQVEFGRFIRLPQDFHCDALPFCLGSIHGFKAHASTLAFACASGHPPRFQFIVCRFQWSACRRPLKAGSTDLCESQERTLCTGVLRVVSVWGAGIAGSRSPVSALVLTLCGAPSLPRKLKSECQPVQSHCCCLAPCRVCGEFVECCDAVACVAAVSAVQGLHSDAQEDLREAAVRGSQLRGGVRQLGPLRGQLRGARRLRQPSPGPFARHVARKWMFLQHVHEGREAADLTQFSQNFRL